jgi:hypothetical protein
MTKFSCKIGDFKSSVVLLKNGQAMEVRRGDKTYFHELDARVYWPSLDAWKATLPEGWVAAIKEDSPSDKYSTTNPVLARFLERARAVCGSRMRRMNNSGNVTLESQACERLKACKTAAIRYPSPLYGTYADEQVIVAEAKLAEILASGKGSEKIYKDSKTHFFTLLPNGCLVGIYYNTDENMIMYRRNSRIWDPLTDPEMQLWFQNSNNRLIKM